MRQLNIEKTKQKSTTLRAEKIESVHGTPCLARPARIDYRPHHMNNHPHAVKHVRLAPRPYVKGGVPLVAHKRLREEKRSGNLTSKWDELVGRR